MHGYTRVILGRPGSAGDGVLLLPTRDALEAQGAHAVAQRAQPLVAVDAAAERRRGIRLLEARA